MAPRPARSAPSREFEPRTRSHAHPGLGRVPSAPSCASRGCGSPRSSSLVGCPRSSRTPTRPPRRRPTPSVRSRAGSRAGSRAPSRRPATFMPARPTATASCTVPSSRTAAAGRAAAPTPFTWPSARPSTLTTRRPARRTQTAPRSRARSSSITTRAVSTSAAVRSRGSGSDPGGLRLGAAARVGISMIAHSCKCRCMKP